MLSRVEIALAHLSENIGRALGPTSPIEIDQKMVNEFAGLTGDPQWVHTDVERAQREMNGTIVHGYFILSLLPQITSTLLRLTGVGHGLNYGLDKVRFPAPLPVGLGVEGSLKIIEVTPRGEGYMMRNEISISIAGGNGNTQRPVCVAENLTLVFPGDGELE